MALPAGAQSTKTDQLVTFNFKNTQLDLVLSEVRNAIQVNLVTHPSIKPENLRVSVEVSAKPDKERGKEKGDTLADLLDQIQSQLGLQRTVWCGAIYLYPKGKKPGAEPTPPKGKKWSRKLTREISIKYRKDEFKKVRNQLQTKLEMKFIMRSHVRRFLRTGDHRVTLRLFRLPAWQVLTHALHAAGLNWSWDDNKAIKIGISGNWKEGKGETFSPVGPGNIGERVVKKGEKLADVAMPVVKVKKLKQKLYIPRSRRSAVRQLVWAGKQVLPQVAKVLRDEGADDPTMLAALEVITKIGDPSEYAALLKVFKDEERSHKVRAAAGSALGAVQAPEAIPDLINALDDDWFSISETARAALVDLGDKSVKPLASAYETWKVKKKGHDGLVYRALLIFGEINTKASKRVLLKAILTQKGARAVPIRHHAAIGLGYTGDPNVILPLINALKRERQFLIAKYITRSLTWITGEKLDPAYTPWNVWWKMKGKRKFADKLTGEDILKEHGGALTHKKRKTKYGDVLELLTLEEDIARNIDRLAHKSRDVRKEGAFNLRSFQGDARKKALDELRKVLDKPKNKRQKVWVEYVIRKIEEADEG